jgi:AbrB family looped-hinge helix DNA binding protein
VKTTVSTRGQIILPADIRRRDDIAPGQEFEVVVVTRNARDFRNAGLKVVDPFS